MFVRNVPLDGGAVSNRPGERPGGDPATELSGLLAAAPRDELTLPCHQAGDADLWFADSPVDLEKAKALCLGCPVKAACLAGAQRRGEPWGVWGGEIFERGEVIARKRPRGRPSKAALARDRELVAAGARL
ncbi:MAG TPA: WhiB family transcriptional regulator [Pseudonocardia sp.]|nr:WhiB family transcriptional regulator [Pseudonocardia sp.]